MSPLHTTLASLGLTPSQIQVFLCCLEYGSLSVARIAHLIHLPRTTVHGYVQDLAEQGLLTANKQTHGTMYQAISPDHLIALLHNKQDRLTQLIQQVEDIKPTLTQLSQKQFALPKIQYYQWLESIESIYKKIPPQTPIWACIDIAVAEYSLWWSVEKLSQTFGHITGDIQELVIDNPAGRHYASLIHRPNHEIRYIDPTQFQWEISLPSDTFCDNTAVHYLSYDSAMIALEIKHPPLMQTRKAMFTIIREHCK